LVIGVKSDILFPVWQQRELAGLLEGADVTVTYVELDSPYGHDTFLIEVDRVGAALRDLLGS
jgi:homoserine O-acetyltransferase